MRCIKVHYLDEYLETQERIIMDKDANWQVFEAGVLCIWKGAPYLYKATWAWAIPVESLLSVEMYDL